MPWILLVSGDKIINAPSPEVRPKRVYNRRTASPQYKYRGCGAARGILPGRGCFFSQPAIGMVKFERFNVGLLKFKF